MRETSDFSEFARAADRMQESASPGGFSGEPRSIDLAKTFADIRRRIRLVLECIVIGGGLSAAAGILVSPTFTATALLAVAEPEGNAQSQNTDSAVDTQIAMLQSQAFLERAFRALAADPALSSVASNVTALERKVKVLQSSKSRLVAVSFSAKSSVLAADAVNKIVRLYVEDPVLQSVESVDDVTIQYAARIKDLEARLASEEKAASGRNDSGDANESLANQEGLREQIATLKLNATLARRRQESRRQNLAAAPPVQLVALATPPMRRSSLSPLFIIGPGTLFSVLFGISLAAVLGRLDTRIYSREQFETLIGRKCAGEVPLRRSKKRARDHNLAYTRALEALVTQTVLLPAPRPRVILLAPSDAAASGLLVVPDFAAVAARILPRVLMINLDISRAPDRASLLMRVLGRAEKALQPDIFDVLAARRRLEEALEWDRLRGIWVLPLRLPISDDPFSFIASERLRRLLDSLPNSFDLVIVGGPPMGAMHEARILALLADAVLLYTRCAASQGPAARAGFEAASQAMNLKFFDARRCLWAALVETPIDRTLVEPALNIDVVARQNPAEASVTAPKISNADPLHEAPAASAQGLPQ